MLESIKFLSPLTMPLRFDWYTAEIGRSAIEELAPYIVRSMLNQKLADNDEYHEWAVATSIHQVSPTATFVIVELDRCRRSDPSSHWRCYEKIYYGFLVEVVKSSLRTSFVFSISSLDAMRELPIDEDIVDLVFSYRLVDRSRYDRHVSEITFGWIEWTPPWEAEEGDRFFPIGSQTVTIGKRGSGYVIHSALG